MPLVHFFAVAWCDMLQYDLKNSRSFLRRSKVDNVRMCDLYLGASVNILGRQLTLVEYANEFTRKRFGFKTERYITNIRDKRI